MRVSFNNDLLDSLENLVVKFPDQALKFVTILFNALKNGRIDLDLGLSALVKKKHLLTDENVSALVNLSIENIKKQDVFFQFSTISNFIELSSLVSADNINKFIHELISLFASSKSNAVNNHLCTAIITLAKYLPQNSLQKLYVELSSLNNKSDVDLSPIILQLICKYKNIIYNTIDKTNLERVINVHRVSNNILSFISKKELTRFSHTSKFFHQQNRNDLEKILVSKLLQHIVYGEFKQAQEIIVNMPKLLLKKGRARDYSGRLIESTALGMAMAAEDFNIREVKNDEQHGNALVGMTEMILYHFKKLPNSEIEIAKQVQDQFPSGWEEKENISYKNDVAMINKVLTVILESKSTTDIQIISACHPVITEFREHFKPKGITTQGRHFNAAVLDWAYKCFDENFYCNDWSDKKNKVKFFWVNVIGYLQRLVPACYAQVMSQGLSGIVNKPTSEKYNEKLKGYIYFTFRQKSFERHFKLRYSCVQTPYFPLDDVTKCSREYYSDYRYPLTEHDLPLRLGYDFAMSHGNIDHYCGISGDARLERILFESFYEEKSLKLHNAIQLLTRVNSLSHSLTKIT